MAKNTRVAAVGRNAALDATLALLNGGTVEIRTGAQPANPEAAATGTLLASFTLNATAFGAAAAGSAAVNLSPAISDASADASGQPGYFRAKRSAGNGSTAIIDGTVGLAGSTPNMVIDTDDGSGNPRITAGQVVNLISWAVSLPDTSTG